jgi:hypothetical protein
MKNRKVKYGYVYQNGIIKISPKESMTVKRIFDSYIDGLSLLKIAQLLNSENIEYISGEVSWNKGKVKRIIDDNIYTGTDLYPSVISNDIYKRAINVKTARDTQKNIDRKSDIYNLNVPILCAECGSVLKRNHDIRCTQGTRWICKNRECHNIIHLNDNMMMKQITNLLNSIIKDPYLIKEDNDRSLVSNDTVRLENEIRKILEHGEINKDSVTELILRNASIKYSNIKTTNYITEKLRADFKMSPLSAFSLPLFAKTVIAITLDKSYIEITLKNNQKIGGAIWNKQYCNGKSIT